MGWTDLVVSGGTNIIRYGTPIGWTYNLVTSQKEDIFTPENIILAFVLAIGLVSATTISIVVSRGLAVHFLEEEFGISPDQQQGLALSILKGGLL